MKLKFVDARFGGSEEITISFERYINGGTTAIELMDADGIPYAPATCNFPGQIEEDCVAVKNYSEGAGMPAILAECGVIEAEPCGWIESGFVRVPLYRLTDEAYEAAQKAGE